MEVTFQTSLKSPLSTMMVSVMGKSQRYNCLVDEAAGHPVTSCPPNRSEMEPVGCVRQVAPWWPYTSPAPPVRLRSVLPPLGLAAALPGMSREPSR
jgi:hypothetical protein